MAILAVLALTAGGCRVGPDPVRPESAAEGVDRFAHAPEGPPSEFIAPGGAWWRLFEDEATNEIVTHILENNPDLERAAASVAAAEASLRAAEGRLWPQVGFTGSAAVYQPHTLQRDQAGGGGLASAFGGGGGIGGLLGGDPLIRLYRTGLNVNWQVDLWGQLARAARAQEWLRQARRADAEALAHTLIAQGVRSRVNIWWLQELRGVTQADLASRRRTLESVELRYTNGLARASDLFLARESEATARAQLRNVERRLLLAVHALEALRGVAPRGASLPEERLPPLPPIPPPPVGLPADLLDRRPDLRASELRAFAEVEQIGIEIADLLPQLRLTAGVGTTSLALGDTLASDSLLLSAVGEIAQTIFTGGTETAQIERARAQARAAAARYAGLVLTALREVEDALVEDQQQREELQAAVAALAHAEEAEELVREQYERGIERLLRVFEAERRRLQAAQRVLRTRRDVWLARVDLHLALGGDWGTHPAAADTSQSAARLSPGEPPESERRDD